MLEDWRTHLQGEWAVRGELLKDIIDTKDEKWRLREIKRVNDGHSRKTQYFICFSKHVTYVFLCKMLTKKIIQSDDCWL